MATAKNTAPPAPAPAPTAQHHFNLGLFLQALIAIAPAVTAPFIKNANSQQIFATETNVAATVLAALNQQK